MFNNIRFIYDNFDRDRIYKILDNFTENKNNEIDEAEDRLKELREIVARSILKQEKVIIDLAEIATKEKDTFFTFQNNL
jgi:hypothetical protein